MTDQLLSLAVKPIITYPRVAQVGKTYLMTIDLQPSENFEWHCDEEEYPIYCTVDSELFSSKPVGEPVIVLHRFGGSYGEAKFLMTATYKEAEGEISITLINVWGVPVKKIKIPGSLRTMQNVISNQEITELKKIANTSDKQTQILDTSLADALIAIIREQMTILHSLGISAWEERLRQLEEQAVSEKFKILFLGEFKRGKSTLINALLAKEVNYEVLPTDIFPSTARITEIKWGSSPHAILHYSNKQSMLVPVEQLNNYVALSYAQDEANENLCDMAEVFLPISFLKPGVEIIDSPGLNDDKSRQVITLNYLERADCIFSILSVRAAFSQSEREIIEHIININKNIIFIFNQFDLISDEDKDRLKLYIKNRLNRLRGLSENEEKKVFFVSAHEALNGRLTVDIDRIQKSGITLLEQEIQELIGLQSRRELRFHRISIVVKESIRESRRVIPMRESLFQADLAELEARHREERHRLEIINEVRSKLDRRISRSHEEIINLVSSKAIQYFSQVAKQIDGWVERYEVREPLALKDFLLWNNASPVRRVALEVAEHLIERIDIEFAQWQSSELQPSITQYLETIFREFGSIQSELDNQLNLIETSSNATEIRRLPASLGLTAISAAIHPELSDVTTIIELVSLTTEKIKKAIGSRLKYEILSSSYERSQQLATTVANSIGTEILGNLNQAFAREFDDIREEILSLAETMQKRRIQVEESKFHLSRLNSQLYSIEQQLDKLEVQLHEQKSIGEILDERQK